MTAFWAFTKKEFMESARTYKLVVLAAVFVLLGIMSPLLAKMIPDILSGVDLGTGMALEMPEATAIDAWTQFFKNVGQMGMLAVIIVFSGIMSNEFGKGTLVNLLTKGLGRGTVVLAKCLAALVIWSGAYALCFGVAAAYTAYFWGLGGLSAFAFIGLWLFGLLLIALVTFGGTLFKGGYGGLLFALGVIIAMTIVNIWPKAGKFNPISLAGDTILVMTGDKSAADFAPAFVICAVCAALLAGATALVFRRRQV